MVVSLRIKTIGDFIEKDDVVVDVGADHGLLELYLIAKHQNIKITAVENKIGPYKILENSLKGLKDVTLSDRTLFNYYKNLKFVECVELKNTEKSEKTATPKKKNIAKTEQ